jgi:hypothetical protein
MKLLLENWRKLINEEVVDFPSEATASERYESYKTHMDSAIEQIKSLEKIFERQGSTTEDLVKIRMSLEILRDDEMLKYDIEGYE